MQTILWLAGALFSSTLVVTVADEKGEPLAGAEVAVWGEEYSDQDETDAEGRARFPDIPAGAFSVLAAAPGFVGDEQHDVEINEGGEVALHFVLPAGVPVAGRVTDRDGQPVAEAYVEATAGGSFEGYGETRMRAPYGRTWTEEDGSFRIGGIPEGAVSTLLVRAEGFEEARVAVRAQGGAVRPSPLTIVLATGGRLLGQVLGPDGKPFAGAAVLVVPAGDEDLRRNPHLTKWSTRREGVTRAIRAESGPDGRFVVRNLALGEAFVALAEAPGFARSAESAVFNVDAAHPDTEVVLALRRAAAIVVKLADPAGAPVSEARVRIGDSMSGLDREEPDGPGLFRFADLPPGSHEVHVTAKGFVARDETVVLGEGETKEVAFALSRGETIAGVLVDGEGKPVPGVTIRAERTVTTSDGWTSQSEAGRAETDEAGRFEIRGLVPGPHVLDLFGAGFILPDGEVEVEAPKTELRLTGAWLGTVSLRLRFPEGSPVPESVFVWDHTPDGSGSGGSRDLAGDCLRFPLHPGRHRIRVLAGEFVPVEREVEIALEEDLDLGEVRLDPGVTLAGRVVDLAGKPVAGALVSHSDYTETSTDEDGRFALPFVPTGPVRVDVAAGGFLDFSEEVRAGGDAVPPVLVLHRGGLLRGRLTDGEGRPLADHWLQVLRPAADPAEKGEHVDEFGTEEDGSYEIRLPAGSYRILFVTKERFTVLAEVVLAEGDVRELDLALPRERPAPAK